MPQLKTSKRRRQIRSWFTRKTPYGLLAILDWIAQAQIILAAGGQVASCLRAIGIRTIFDIPPLAVSETSMKIILEWAQPDFAKEPTEEHFNAFYRTLTRDINVRRPGSFWKLMELQWMRRRTQRRPIRKASRRGPRRCLIRRTGKTRKGSPMALGILWSRKMTFATSWPGFQAGAGNSNPASTSGSQYTRAMLFHRAMPQSSNVR
jgi:hypothetical protein